MPNPWFRLYAEIINDPKVLVVTEALRWRYVALLCIHCNEQYENVPDDEVALALRVTEQEWLETKQLFIKRKLLAEDGSISGWEKRQYISDLKDPTAAERQKRYRENKRNNRNASVTSRAPESDTDTDTDINITHDFEKFFAAYPNKKDKKKALAAWRKTKPNLQDVLNALQWQKKTKNWIDGFIPLPSTYLNGERWKDEPEANKQQSSANEHTKGLKVL